MKEVKLELVDKFTSYEVVLELGLQDKLKPYDPFEYVQFDVLIPEIALGAEELVMVDIAVEKRPGPQELFDALTRM